MWGFKYYSVSTKMPYKLEKKEVPKKIIRCENITDKIFLSLNFIAPMLFGIGLIGTVLMPDHADFF